MVTIRIIKGLKIPPDQRIFAVNHLACVNALKTSLGKLALYVAAIEAPFVVSSILSSVWFPLSRATFPLVKGNVPAFYRNAVRFVAARHLKEELPVGREHSMQLRKGAWYIKYMLHNVKA